MGKQLTKFSRDEITRRAVAFAFDKRTADLAAEEDALAREAYASIFTPAELKAASKLPANWLRFDACLRFNVGGQSLELKVVGEGLPVPYRPRGSARGGYNCERLGVIPPGELCDRIQAHAIANEQLRADKRTAERTTRDMLDRVTTTGKLTEIWPEGKPFYADMEERPVAALPAIRIDEVNGLLGLAKAA